MTYLKCNQKRDLGCSLYSKLQLHPLLKIGEESTLEKARPSYSIDHSIHPNIHHYSIAKCLIN